MPTVATQKWVTDFVLPVVSIAIVSFGAYAVWRQRWFRVRPVLSSYVWFLAITGAASSLMFYLQQVCSGTIQYALCRAYLIGYHAITILTCLLTVAVVYEFLFRLAGTDNKIRRAAVAGFAITISLIIAGTYALLNTASTPNTLQAVAQFVFATTALALVSSGIYILAIKKTRSLILETRLLMVFVALAFYDFLDLLSSFALRGSEQTKVIAADVFWIAFAILLYWALKNGPAIPSAITE